MIFRFIYLARTLVKCVECRLFKLANEMSSGCRVENHYLVVDIQFLKFKKMKQRGLIWT